MEGRAVWVGGTIAAATGGAGIRGARRYPHPHVDPRTCRKRSMRHDECSGPWPSYPCGRSSVSPHWRCHLVSAVRQEERLRV